MDFLKIIKDLIKENWDLIKDYELIAIFGSCLYKKNPGDIDLVTIGNDKNHRNFILKLKDHFSKRGYKFNSFNTVRKKPQKINSNHILIHDLHHPTLNDMLKREWNDVINEIKFNSKVLYGSKEKIPQIKVNEKYFYLLWIDWCRRINSLEDYKNFREYLIKIIPYLYKIHPTLNLRPPCEKILLELNNNKNNKNWVEVKKNITSILSNL